MIPCSSLKVAFRLKSLERSPSFFVKLVNVSVLTSNLEIPEFELSQIFPFKSPIIPTILSASKPSCLLYHLKRSVLPLYLHKPDPFVPIHIEPSFPS